MSPWPSVGHVSALPDVVEFSWKAARVSCALIQNLCHRWNDRTEGVEHSYYYRCVMFSSGFRMTPNHPNHWHVRFKSSWRHMQSTPPALTPASLCQNLSVASWYPDACWSWKDQFTPAIGTRFQEYFVAASHWQGKVHLPTQIPSPKMIPSVDQQSHTWDDSEIVTGYWGILYQLRRNMSILHLNGHPNAVRSESIYICIHA